MSKTKADLEKELGETLEESVARGERIKFLELELKAATAQVNSDAQRLQENSAEIFRLQREVADASLALKIIARLNSGHHERQRDRTATIHSHWRWASKQETKDAGAGAWVAVEKDSGE